MTQTWHQVLQMYFTRVLFVTYPKWLNYLPNINKSNPTITIVWDNYVSISFHRFGGFLMMECRMQLRISMSERACVRVTYMSSIRRLRWPWVSRCRTSRSRSCPTSSCTQCRGERRTWSPLTHPCTPSDTDGHGRGNNNYAQSKEKKKKKKNTSTAAKF